MPLYYSCASFRRFLMVMPTRASATMTTSRDRSWAPLNVPPACRAAPFFQSSSACSGRTPGERLSSR
ncbi:hypothetical protein EV356DRAFT_346650 [Viridothelium virens]|uniref:Uncharacterized protein n=1 Tax=Viridothelium virens TaxID=1048519 RepID=A0A6A6GX22_VIRVR|nr:hypothetical protein EV356DRAFT_346650 [Viridothelium virens]